MNVYGNVSYYVLRTSVLSLQSACERNCPHRSLSRRFRLAVLLAVWQERDSGIETTVCGAPRAVNRAMGQYYRGGSDFKNAIDPGGVHPCILKSVHIITQSINMPSTYKRAIP